MTAGDIYSVAGTGSPGYAGHGGPAAAAEVAYPQGVAVDGSGNLVIADTDNARVRVVAARTGTFYQQAMTHRHIRTVASNGAPSHQEGNQGFSGDTGPALRCRAGLSRGVAVDGLGTWSSPTWLVERVRGVAAAPGRKVYGRAMTGDDIYTVAGTGTEGAPGSVVWPTRPSWSASVRRGAGCRGKPAHRRCWTPAPRVAAAATARCDGQGHAPAASTRSRRWRAGAWPGDVASDPCRAAFPAGAAVDHVGNLADIAGTRNRAQETWPRRNVLRPAIHRGRRLYCCSLDKPTMATAVTTW